MSTRSALGIAALLPLLAAPLGAQEWFGQNQVQYSHFKWSVKETPHFLIHYYAEEQDLITPTAQMAERSYERLSRVIGHQFREKKPIILFASRSDFAQNNVTGDLGEGTGGVTEGLRQRVIIPYTGDLGSFERVLTHELVHSFQYDLFARGRATNGLDRLAEVDPPLWFIEGMAEYLALGPGHTLTDAWIRDGAINGTLPTIEQMTERPDQFFPYRYGESIWEYVGGRWGDQAIGRILLATPALGIGRAMQRELGVTLEDLSDEWREAMQAKHLPQLASLQRPRKLGTAMLNNRRSGGDIFIAPALSPDGRYIAFLSRGSFLKGEVFIDLWLADARTGRRITRLVKSTTNPDFEELRLLYSQSSFSADGKLLAFTAQRGGRDVINIMDVAKRKVIATTDFALEWAASPAFSPDGRRVVFSGGAGGSTDLYLMDVDGTNLQQLTRDRYGDLQPQWSPDGNTIAFVSERGPGTNLDSLRFGPLTLALYDLRTNELTVPEGQGGITLNPQWSPNGGSIAYVTDRTGTANLFLYDLTTKSHYQLTNVAGAISAITEFSPAISWARGADRLAFTYFENGDYTIWSIDNPRALMREPFRATAPPPRAVATTPIFPPPALTLPPNVLEAVAALQDTSRTTSSFYRGDNGAVRRSASVVAAGRQRPGDSDARARVAEIPDTTLFRDRPYKSTLEAEYISRPTLGYAGNNYGRAVYGGTTLVFADMLNNHNLGVSANLNGRLSEMQAFAAYDDRSHRWGYQAGFALYPNYYAGGQVFFPGAGNLGTLEETIYQITVRQLFGQASYPLNRFKRIETQLTFTQQDRTTLRVAQTVDLANNVAGPFYIVDQTHESGRTFLEPGAFYVYDNTLADYAGPISGQRYRVGLAPILGGLRWTQYIADYRRYDPILFDFITLATRLYTRQYVGRDEVLQQQYIGYSYWLRGYNRNPLDASCPPSLTLACGENRVIGSRVALANAELRFPLLREFNFGALVFPLPLVDGVAFYDVGLAWNHGNRVQLHPKTTETWNDVRTPLRSYGLGIRLNLFNYALLRWDYAIPLDNVVKKGFWTFTIGPSY